MFEIEMRNEEQEKEEEEEERKKKLNKFFTNPEMITYSQMNTTINGSINFKTDGNK